MKPLARNRVFALLWPLLAALPAVSRAADGEPLDFKKTKVEGEARRQFEYLGYRFEEKTGRILGPDGTTLGLEKFKDLVSPYDFHKVPVPDEERSQLTIEGCRFDEESGHILILDDKTKAKVPLPKLTLEFFQKQSRLAAGHEILERMSLLLSQQPSDKPLPDEVKAQLKSMLERSPGAAVPEALVKAINAPGAAVPEARALVEKAYTDSTRFFDGQQTLGEHFKSAMPVLPGWNKPHKPAQFFDDNERRLGNALRASAQEHFARSPIGQELLDHFKDKHGKVKLPPFLVLDIDERMGAVYNQTNKTVVVNQRYVVDGLTAHLPERERDALRLELKDSKKFAAYLLAHPEAREAFLKQQDVTIFHELTHAWQDRRERLFDEMGRGNTPAVIHLEYEHEAFIQENRYMHWKVLHDPASAKDDPMLPSYMEMLSDFDKFRDGVTQQYYQLFPKNAATLATVNDLQKERVSAARRLMGESLHAGLVEMLRLFGMARGSSQIKRVESSSRKRMEAFLKDEYPRMQEEGRRGIVEVYLLNAQDDKTAIERDSDLLTAEEWAKATQDEKLIERVRKAKDANK
ncbi:MAG: hypothetical protein HY077_11170 [Elusimicrobia bacterium]|nr:hypothetical protein [Elusimicrobiota bacterium]